MRIIGKIAADDGYDYSNIYKGPYPVGHCDLSEIDVSETALKDCLSDCNRDEFAEFLQGKSSICFCPNLFLPFAKPSILRKFYVSHHSCPGGITDFSATFTTSDGKKITKEYRMGEVPPYHHFWQVFPIDVDNVISCNIDVSPSHLPQETGIFGIRFVVDKEKEAEHLTIEHLLTEPWK
eukprot:gnl/Carplike_NY0171/9008_a12541_134.p1 GENE.gnl/Carplike_NY0171/9008_a12541_134~~gnl/Carplike_NY0171/9008_a12541_134.p1  ORF type:complete len:198 (-),score=27.62 gnl/Carplike_NY0171/9008_a12541_134:124-660(-)